MTTTPATATPVTQLASGAIIELDEVHYGKWVGVRYKVEHVYHAAEHVELRLLPMHGYGSFVRTMNNRATVRVIS